MLGFAFLAFLNGNLVPGVEFICKAINLENAIKTADIVVTGEGRLDAQTIMGKAPQRCSRYSKSDNTNNKNLCKIHIEYFEKSIDTIKRQGI